MKKIMLSLMIMALASATAIGATRAYFSSGQVLGSNTFTTGTVKLGNFNATSLNVSGLYPGHLVTIPNFAVYYEGNISADLYIGARGTDTTMLNYLADKTYLKIYLTDNATLVWEGMVNTLSSGWRKIATNTSAGWKAYNLQFTLLTTAGNEYQGKNNTNTEILVYAVQTGAGVPSLIPQETLSNATWFNLN